MDAPLLGGPLPPEDIGQSWTSPWKHPYTANDFGGCMLQYIAFRLLMYSMKCLIYNPTTVCQISQPMPCYCIYNPAVC